MAAAAALTTASDRLLLGRRRGRLLLLHLLLRLFRFGAGSVGRRFAILGGFFFTGFFATAFAGYFGTLVFLRRFRFHTLSLFFGLFSTIRVALSFFVLCFNLRLFRLFRLLRP